jgi:hypothetical protein
VPGDFQYSAYETRDGLAQGGAAIVRYGLVGRDPAGTNLVPAVPGLCSDPDALGFITLDTTTDKLVLTCPEGVVAPDPGVDPLLRAAEQGFFDPYTTNGADKTPILPIIVNVAALGAAMVTEQPGDLGQARCLNEDAVRCPEQRRFRGSVWIGTLPSGIQANGTPNPATMPGGTLPDGTPRRPCPLEGNGTTTCARPNAVVLTNMDDLGVFQRSGLSIASNLPIYVMGNVNNATPPAFRTARIALMAPSITGLAADFDMASVAWSAGPSASASATTATLEWHTSLFTGWPSEDTTLRDPARHLLRRIQSGLRINVTGSVVAMFRRQDYDRIQQFNPGNGSFSSPLPDPLVVGLPMFIPDDNNPEEEGSRLASGTLRYPGENARDLRRAAIEHQPPASPRFSIDPAPIDRR